MTALIFDTETHNLHGEIIEAAWMDVNFVQGAQNNVYFFSNYDHYGSQRYKPSEPINLVAMAVHNIIDEDLETAHFHQSLNFLKGHRLNILLAIILITILKQ